MPYKDSACPLPPPPPTFCVKNNAGAPQVEVHKIEINQQEEIDRLIILELSQNPHLCNHVVYKCFNVVTTILQDGPTCGMVALSMGLSGRWKVEQLLDMCVSQGWSRRGEMYSCEWMTKIALQAGAKARHLRGGLKNHLECITRCLAIGGSLLVPYDKGKDHSPIQAGGTKAHWALITGVLLVESTNAASVLEDIVPCNCSKKDSASVETSASYGLTKCSSVLIEDGEVAVKINDGASSDAYVAPYVCAFQGQSKRLKLWSWWDLVNSCENLEREGAEREGEVIVPAGGVAAGLKGQAVLLFKE